MTRIYGTQQGTAFSNGVQQRLNQVDTNQNGVSLREIKQITGNDLTLSQAEAQAQGIDETSRVALNNALAGARNSSMSPETVIFPGVQSSGNLSPSVRREISNQPQVVSVGRDTSNFMRQLTPLNSGGDSIQLKLSGEAGVGWGWFGAEAGGSVNVNVNRGDDGAFYVGFSASGEIGATAGRMTSAGGAQVGVAGGLEMGATYRFRNAQEANDFLVYQMRQNIPGVDHLFPNLDSGKDMSRVRPTTRVGAYGRVSVEGGIKLGSVQLAGGGSLRAETIRTTYPNGNVGHDWSVKGSAHASLTSGGGGIGVQLDGSYNRYHVENHFVPENNGDYVAVEGSISLNLTAAQARAFNGGEKGAILGSLMQAGLKLGLSGEGMDRFIEGATTRIEDAMSRSGGKGVSNSRGLSLTIGVQAQWSIEENKDQRLQYFRLGTGATLSTSAGFDAGVAHGKVEGSASIMNYTNLTTGTTDITYLQGLYFENRSEYNQLKADIGGASTQVQGKALSQWEREWANPRYDRTLERIR